MGLNKDEGFGRNVRTIFGVGNDYEGMGERDLLSVEVTPDKGRLIFKFVDGYEARFVAEGDCCSQTWIEHLEAPADVRGQRLVAVDDARTLRTEDDPVHDCLQVYQTVFRTNKGETISVEYRNASNGYFGGYLERERN